MGPAIWFELVDPAELLENSRYERRPDAPPYPTSGWNSPLRPEPLRTVKAAAREIHALHFQIWDPFARRLRQILQPYPALVTAVTTMIHDANSKFLKPLQEIGWKFKPA